MKENLPFRPLDNSSTTKLSYSLEAQHWSEAQSSNQIRNRTTSVTQIGGLIGAVVTILVSVISIVITGLFWLIKKIF